MAHIEKASEPLLYSLELKLLDSLETLHLDQKSPIVTLKKLFCSIKKNGTSGPMIATLLSITRPLNQILQFTIATYLSMIPVALSNIIILRGTSIFLLNCEGHATDVYFLKFRPRFSKDARPRSSR